MDAESARAQLEACDQGGGGWVRTGARAAAGISAERAQQASATAMRRRSALQCDTCSERAAELAVQKQAAPHAPAATPHLDFLMAQGSSSLPGTPSLC